MDLVKNIEVNGYEFLGWYDNPDFDGEKIERLEKGIIISFSSNYITHLSFPLL